MAPPHRLARRRAWASLYRSLCSWTNAVLPAAIGRLLLRLLEAENRAYPERNLCASFQDLHSLRKIGHRHILAVPRMAQPLNRVLNGEAPCLFGRQTLRPVVAVPFVAVVRGRRPAMGMASRRTTAYRENGPG